MTYRAIAALTLLLTSAVSAQDNATAYTTHFEIVVRVGTKDTVFDQEPSDGIAAIVNGPVSLGTTAHVFKLPAMFNDWTCTSAPVHIEDDYYATHLECMTKDRKVAVLTTVGCSSTAEDKATSDLALRVATGNTVAHFILICKTENARVQAPVAVDQKSE